MAPAAKDLVDMNDAALMELHTAVLREIDRRRVLAEAQARQAEIAAQYAAAVANEPARDIASLPEGAVIGPGGRVTVNGVEYVNTSGAFLCPRAAGPDRYPQGWKQTTPPPAGTAPAWAAGTTYAVGARATYQGTVYKCLQAHTSQADWTPPAVPALWAPA